MKIMRIAFKTNFRVFHAIQSKGWKTKTNVKRTHLFGTCKLIPHNSCVFFRLFNGKFPFMYVFDAFDFFFFYFADLRGTIEWKCVANMKPTLACGTIT